MKRAFADGSWNPITLAGALVLGITMGLVPIVDQTVEATVVQAALPITVGLGMIVYGRFMREAIVGHRRSVLTWLVVATVVFLFVGAFFATISRRYETSFELAMLGSLAAGALFGTVIGVYAARLRRANERLERKSDRMEEFAAIVSHDLRNPLNVAQGRVDLAREDRADEHLATAAGALDRMESLITDLLTLAREDALVRTVERRDLSTAVEEAWGSVVDTTTASATLVVERDGTIRADPDRLQQVLENLFRNAVQHAGSDVTVTVGVLEDGFYVADDGPGFPVDGPGFPVDGPDFPDDDPSFPDGAREGVLEPGHTADTSGTGLGLQIVGRIADAHGWDVTIAESADGGARIEFRGGTAADGGPGPADRNEPLRR